MVGFYNEFNFTCKYNCQFNFDLGNLQNGKRANAVMVRNMIANGIPKERFQRWLQVGNFGAVVNNQEKSINLVIYVGYVIYDGYVQGPK